MINSLTGEFRYSLDNKSRVNIPAKFRQWITDDLEYTFVVTKGSDPCLVAYPVVEWNAKAEKLLKLTQFKKKNRAFIRAFGRSASRLKCDKQGRILIPQQLLEWAHIKKDVVIIGTLNSVEIWDPETLENHKESQISIDDEYFEDLGDLL